MFPQGLSAGELEVFDQAQLAGLPRVGATSAPYVAAKLEEINQRAPWLSPETSLTLAKANASTPAIDYAGQLSSWRDIENNGRYDDQDPGEGFVSERLYDAGFWAKRFASTAFGKTLGAGAKAIARGTSWAWGTFVDPAAEVLGIKEATRFGFALLDSSRDTVANVGSWIFMRKQGDKSLRGFWDTTSIGVFYDKPELRGDGWFISEEMRKEQERRATDFRGKVYGQGYTIGRGAAGLIIPEKNLAYGLLSGAIDAALLMISDPTGPISKGISKSVTAAKFLASPTGRESVEWFLRGGSLKMPLLAEADLVAIREARAAAGVTKDLTGVNINYDLWRKWMTSNPQAKRMVDRVSKTTSTREILEDIFKFNITTDVAAALAKAKTGDEVLQVFEQAAVMGPTAFKGNFGKYVRTSHGLGAADIFEKSRFITKLPRGHVVTSGSPIDNINALKNMIRTMRQAGVTEKNIDTFTEYAVRGFSNFGSPTARINTVRVFESYLDNVMEANGIIPEVREAILRGGSKTLDRVSNWMLNRQGVNTDNGLIQAFITQVSNAGLMTREQTAALLNDALNIENAGQLRLLQPVEIAKLLNRVHILPDPRQVRRVTRNRFISKFLQSRTPDDLIETQLPETINVGGEMISSIKTQRQAIKKLPIAGRRVRTNTNVIQDRAEYRRLRSELDDLVKSQTDGNKSAELKDDIAAIKSKMQDLVVEERVWALTGEQRWGIRALEMIQAQLWKPLNLMTGGYIVRNMIDAQYRMSRAGLASVPSHPAEYIALVLGRRYRRSISGVDITGAGWTTKTKLPEDILEEISNANSRVGIDAMDRYQHGRLSGSFPIVNAYEGGLKNPRTLHTRALIQEAQRVQRKDPLMRMVIRMRASGYEKKEILDFVLRQLDNPGSDYFKKIDDLHASGMLGIGRDGKVIQAPQVRISTLFKQGKKGKEAGRQYLREYVDRVLYENALTYTGDLDDVRILFGYNATARRGKKGMESFVVPSKELVGIEDLMGRTPDGGAVANGFIARWENAPGGAVNGAVIGQAAGREGVEFTFVPFAREDALTVRKVGLSNKRSPRYGTLDAQRVVEKAPIYDSRITDPSDPMFNKGLPVNVAYEQRIFDEEFKVRDTLDFVADWFFNQLYETGSRVLERAPAFRQFYYRALDEQMNMLSSVEAQKILTDLAAKANLEKVSVREYLGVKPVGWERLKVNFTGADDFVTKLEKIAKNSAHKGTATAQELDDFAKYAAIHDVKDLLYDVSDVWAVEESLKLIAPFVSAWKEVISTYGRFLMEENIKTVRSFQRVYSGLQQADPDNDGRGFFYRAPDTGDMMFTFPFSGKINQALTGIYAPLEAPVKGLSQGINVYPALGPYAQFAVSKIIPDKPEYFELYEFLLPYGKTEGIDLAKGLVPGWMRKMTAAIQANPDDMTNLYANTYVEVVRALSVNPKYDLGSEEGRNQLLSDAKGRARVLLGMRALSQFTGPVAGTYDIAVPTKQGDMYVTELTKELERLQRDDYDSAISNFLNLYGDDLMLYVASKSRSTQEGLETSKEFGMWQLANKELMTEYPNVASYLAPKGSGFEFSIWQKQMEEGARVRLTAREIIKLAQERIGKVRYRAAQKLFGPYPTADQRSMLFQYRQYLHSELPGFPLQTEFVINKFNNNVAELEDLIDDSRVKRSSDAGTRKLAETIGKYLNERNKALNMVGGKSLKSKKATPLRYQLFALGEQFADQNPDFDRIWQRFLSAEVED